MTGIVWPESNQSSSTNNDDDDSDSDKKYIGIGNGWSRILIIVTTTALVLVLTWKFHSVGDGQGLRFGYRVGVIKTDSIVIDELAVKNKTETKESRTNNTKSSEDASIKKKNSESAGEKIAIKKEQEAATNEKQVATTGDETKEIVSEDNQSGDDEKETTDSNTNEDAAFNRMTPNKRKQVENYRNQTALIINIHVTHHAGTTMCKAIGMHGINGSIAPSFVCLGDKEEVMPDPPNLCDPVEDPFCSSFKSMKKKVPWSKEETGPFAKAIRPYFHFISWEFSRPPRKALALTEWEYSNLVSIIVTRDPISRLLASDGITSKKFPGFNTGELDRKGWWDYAAYQGSRNTDNFFLRILAGASKPRLSEEQTLIQNHVKKGINRTTEEVLELFPTMIGEKEFESAKSLLDRFTFVLDIACLSEGIEALRDVLWIEQPPTLRRRMKETHKQKKERLKKLTLRDHIGYDDVYEYLVAKNEWDIALYEYSKTISLVRCQDLPPMEAAVAEPANNAEG